jgi:hypothetical protein
MIRIALKHPAIGALRCFEFFLLFVHVTDLEPDILFGQRPRRIGNDVLEALQTCQSGSEIIAHPNLHLNSG